MKIFDAELKVMEVLWKVGQTNAAHLAREMAEQTGWSANTTYTVINKLVAKGAIERSAPKFTCRALITRKQVQEFEAQELIAKLFDGSAEIFLSAFVSGAALSAQELERLKQRITELQ